MSHVILLAPLSMGAVAAASALMFGKDAAIWTESLATPPTEAQVRLWQADGKLSYTVPPARSILVASITATTAQITWVVDQPSATMRVKYGPTTALASTQAATPAIGVGAVVCNLTGLTTATPYFYSVQVFDLTSAYGSFSPTYTFTTA